MSGKGICFIKGSIVSKMANDALMVIQQDRLAHWFYFLQPEKVEGKTPVNDAYVRLQCCQSVHLDFSGSG